MDLELGETQRAVEEAARAFARERLAPKARENDRAGRFPEAQIRELCELGLSAINVPEALGGAGAGPVAYVLAMMQVAAADTSVAVTMAVTNMVGEIISRFGSPAQQQ